MSAVLKVMDSMPDALSDRNYNADKDTIAPLTGAVAGLGAALEVLENRLHLEKAAALQKTAQKEAQTAESKARLGQAINYLEQAIALLENPR